MSTSVARKSGNVDWKKMVLDSRWRLSADPRKPGTQERLARLLGVSWSTVARWESTGRVDPPMGRKLARLGRVLDALGEMIVREDRIRFLEEKHPLLLGLRPLDLLDNDSGSEKVVELLEGMETGSFA